MENWRFVLAQSSDMKNLSELTQARGKEVNSILNRGGSLSFTHPMREPIAGSIEPITTCIKAYRYAAKTATWSCVWSGPVWTIEESVHEERMKVNCIGWVESMLAKRLLRTAKNYVSLDDGEIVRLLLEHANRTTLEDFTSPTYSVPLPAGWANAATRTHIEWGGTLPNQGSGGATAYTTATRNKSYQRYQPIGPAIQELTELENGCDIYVSPEDRKLWVFRRRERVRDVVFGHNWGPNNLQQFTRSFDSSQATNFVQVTGRQGILPQYADTASPFTGWRTGANNALDPNPDTRQQYGLMEEIIHLADVSDPAVLGAYAAGEIYVRYRPRIVYSMTPFPFTVGGPVPEPFVDYDVGDRVLLTAQMSPRLSILNQQVRVFGISLTIDEEGNEKLGALQTSPV